MMIKLISRETDKTSYALIKEFRGGFVAWWWQVFAKIVGADLKDDFDISKRASHASRIIRPIGLTWCFGTFLEKIIRIEAKAMNREKYDPSVFS